MECGKCEERVEGCKRFGSVRPQEKEGEQCGGHWVRNDGRDRYPWRSGRGGENCGVRRIRTCPARNRRDGEVEEKECTEPSKMKENGCGSRHGSRDKVVQSCD